MLEALIGLGGVLLGTIGLAIVRKALDRGVEKRSDLVTVLDQLRTDYNRVTAYAKDLEVKMADMTGKIAALKAETEESLETMREELGRYREKYYGALDQLVETQQELARYARKNGMEVDNPGK